MADGGQSATNDPVGSYFSPGGDNVKLIYILYIVSAVVGITMLVGLVLAYINRGHTAGSWIESHYTYQIRTFWIGLLYAVVCIVLMLVGIGFLLIIAVFVWGIVRSVRGLQWASTGKPVPNPRTWIV